MQRKSDTIRWWIGAACAAGWLRLAFMCGCPNVYVVFCAIVAVLAATRKFSTTVAFKCRYHEIKMLHIGLNSHLWHWADVVYLVTGKAK